MEINLKYTFGQDVWWISKVSDYTELIKIGMKTEHYCIERLTIQDIVISKEYLPEYYVHEGEPVKEKDLFKTKEEAIERLIEIL